MKFHQLLIIVVSPTVANALWPIPRSLQVGTDFLKISPQFDINTNVANAPRDLLDAVSRTKAFIKTDRLQRLIVGRGANDSAKIAHAPTISRLTLSLLEGHQVLPIAQEAVKPINQRVEEYSLTVPNNGSDAVITAKSTLGLFRGLTTFEQLWYDLQGITYTYQAPIKITNDSPAYPYRGLMLDTARHFFPVTDIKRTLDTMSLVKMSTFHWHASDSQSFPVTIPGFPELSSKGAYSADDVYSSDDIHDIVTYAGERGIDVLMEIDTPGHTAAIWDSHPEYIACGPGAPGGAGSDPPAGELRVASSDAMNFTASLLASIAKTLPSTFFSTGGDEVNTGCYNQDPETQATLKASGKTLEQVLGEFVQATHKPLLDMGKSPVVWEEMALEHEVPLSNETVVMVWISSQHAASVASKNLRLVHAPSDYFYLDCGAGGWLGNFPTGNSWCDPFKTWSKAYTFDPLANLTSAQSSLVLGGQQLLWAEQSSPENMDSIIWPRAASSAEIFWTGANLPDGTPRDVASALPRLHDVRYRMVQRGVRAIALQPHWCALRPNACDR